MNVPPLPCAPPLVSHDVELITLELGEKQSPTWHLLHSPRALPAGTPQPAPQTAMLILSPPMHPQAKLALGLGTPLGGGRRVQLTIHSTVKGSLQSQSALTMSGTFKVTSSLAGVAQWIERRPANHGIVVRFPVRARAWVAGLLPSRGRVKGNHTLMFPSPSFSFPSPLSENKYIKSS